MTQDVAVHLFLALLWGQLALALAPSWMDGTYYSYGWLVMAASAWFYLTRRRDFACRPLRSPAARSSGDAPVLMVLAVLVAGAAALRLLQGANPFWRLLLWAQGLLTLLATGLLFAQTEGLRAVRHYLPALVLILAAIPLPSRIEAELVQRLTRSVVLVSSDLARASGIPLEVSDTAFIIRGNPLDVNDQCSGIRSFQSSLAVALIVGEMLRLNFLARLGLLFFGALASFAGNSFRVLALVQAFFDGGPEGLEARHDSAGMITLTLTYGLILTAGFLLDRGTSRPPSPDRKTQTRSLSDSI